MINVTKLHKELTDEGIPITGVNSDGVVSFQDSATKDQMDLASKIVANHNPVWYVDLRTGPGGYGTFGDQLDMLYDDLMNGTTTWKDHITDVKKRFPK